MIAEQFNRMAAETVPADELEKSRSMVKGRFVLRTEGPQGLIMYGLSREVLEGEVLEPRSCSREVRRGDGRGRQRVAQDLIANDKTPARRDRAVRRPGPLPGSCLA